ncbi:MAG: mitochondrial fission ELM1 family protein [Chromatocurvus sp.]
MPAIWLIDAYRAGERRQVRALATAASDALGWPCRTLQLGYRQNVFWPHLLRQASLTGVQRADRQKLSAPWPDLVITTGVRNEPVGRWLRQASGGHTRYVHVGRPWGRLQDFDLLVTTPQYRVPQHHSVLHNDLTLHDLTAEGLARSAAAWGPRFADLPRPWIGVLVGGDSGPYTLGPRAADRLLDQAMEAATRCGGSLLIATSARTAAAVHARLRRRLTDASAACPHYLYCWAQDESRGSGEGSRKGSGEGSSGGSGDDSGKSHGNPYPGILALADAFVVSADSIAMLSEACATGRPVAMFDSGGMRRDAARHAGTALHASGASVDAEHDWRLGGSLFAQLIRWFPDTWSRDISLVHRALEDSGRAFWLEAGGFSLCGDGAPRSRGELASCDTLADALADTLSSPDMHRALARIEALVKDRRKT